MVFALRKCERGARRHFDVRHAEGILSGARGDEELEKVF
jgi:hypothetical protein